MKHLIVSVLLLGALIGNGINTLILAGTSGPSLLVQNIWLIPSFLYTRWALRRFRGIKGEPLDEYVDEDEESVGERHTK